MALPNQLGHGGTGFHGDDAVRLRTTLSALRTLGNEIKADHNATLAKLDADTGVGDTNYASLRTIAAADVSAIPATLGQGGSFLHGNDGIQTRLILQALRTLANEIKADYNALLTKLDADSLGDSDYAAAVSTNEQQLITVTGATGGTFTLTYAGQTTDAIAYNASAATVQIELEQLSNIEVGDVTVTGSAGGPYTVAFAGNLAGADIAAITSDTTNLLGTNEVQTVTVDATSGNFTLTYSGQTTANIAYNAAASAVESALVALSNIAPGDVAVSGGPGGAGGATPYTITFGGTLAKTNVAQITGADVDLAGGGDSITTGTTTPGVAPTVVITTPTPGVEPKTILTADVAAIKADFGAGGANLHGQDAIALDVTISRLITLLNEAKRKRNAMLAKLDADGTVNGTNYVSLHATAAADAS